MLLLSLLVALALFVTLGLALVWVVAEVREEPPVAPLMPRRPAPPTGGNVEVEAVVVFWSEFDHHAILDCVVSDGPRQGVPFSAHAELPLHPVLATATENLLERWSTRATHVSVSTVGGRAGPELRLSDGEATIRLALSGA